MTPAAIATARRLVAGPWRERRGPGGFTYADSGWLPDLEEDPGTAGALLADLHQLAIARRLEIRISWEPDEGEWRVGACHEDDHTGGAAGYAPDFGHAVALALLAVHETTP